MDRAFACAGRAHLATPCGLLFNELVHAPQLIVANILAMVDAVLELDEGN